MYGDLAYADDELSAIHGVTFQEGAASEEYGCERLSLYKVNANPKVATPNGSWSTQLDLS